MKILTVIACTLTLLACGTEESAESESAANERRALPAAEARAPTVGKKIADDFNNSMDRAKNVETQVMQQKDKIDAALRQGEDDT